VADLPISLVEQLGYGGDNYKPKQEALDYINASTMKLDAIHRVGHIPNLLEYFDGFIE